MSNTYPHTGTWFSAQGRYGNNPQRRQDAMTNAGCVHSAFSKWSGALVSIYDAEQAGIDASTRWVCLCEDHGTLLDVAKMSIARSMARVPDWCEKCYSTAEEVSDHLDRWEEARGRPSRRTA